MFEGGRRYLLNDAQYAELLHDVDLHGRDLESHGWGASAIAHFFMGECDQGERPGVVRVYAEDHPDPELFEMVRAIHESLGWSPVKIAQAFYEGATATEQPMADAVELSPTGAMFAVAQALHEGFNLSMTATAQVLAEALDLSPAEAAAAVHGLSPDGPELSR